MPKRLHLAAIAALLFLLPSQLPGQTCSVVLPSIPATTQNTRYFSNVVPQVVNPSLSLNGFTCSRSGGNCNYGYGLKEILERVYRTSPDDMVKGTYEQILAQADSSFLLRDPNSKANIETNIQTMQARGFVALATYVLEKNGYRNTQLNGCTQGRLPSHATALAQFKEALRTSSAWMG